MKKVLILTAGFGEGHNAAARNTRDALESISEEVSVEVLDLFESTYGAFNTLVKKSYLGLVQYAPRVWGGLYQLLDQSELIGRNLGGLTRLKRELAELLRESQPDIVVSTYPVYAHVIQEIFRDHAERPFRLITIVTDSITVNSAWFRAPSDVFCVPNEETAKVMREAGVPAKKIRTLGFPVSLVFAQETKKELEVPTKGVERRILYIINTGKKKAGKVIDRLLDIPNARLTITVGRDADLKAELTERFTDVAERVEILGWTNQMPQLMLRSHVVISKAGGATVQEAIAARCPMIVNQVIPGQEEGNAELISRFKLGAVAERNREVSELVTEAFAHRAQQWSEWRDNLQKISRPGRLVAHRRVDARGSGAHRSLAPPPETLRGRGQQRSSAGSSPRLPAASAQMLLCDFHIHSNYSDGKLSVHELVDFYGKRGFDCICITDHLADPRRMIGKLVRPEQPDHQPQPARRVFQRDRARTPARVAQVPDAGDDRDGVQQGRLHQENLRAPARRGPQGAHPRRPRHHGDHRANPRAGRAGHRLASARHEKRVGQEHALLVGQPGDCSRRSSTRGRSPTGTTSSRPSASSAWRSSPNSDFHKPKHIYSWKTLLHCAKEPEAIKECIRQNQHLSITLYRDGQSSRAPVNLEFAPSTGGTVIPFDPHTALAAAH